MADFGMNLLEHGGGVPNVFDSRIDDHSGTRSLSSLSDSSHGEPGDSFGGFLRGFVHQIVPRVSAGDYEYNAGMHSHVALPLSTGPHLSAQTPEFVPGELSMNGQYGATSSVASESQLPSSRYSGSTNIYVPQLTLDFTGENQQLFDQYSHFSTGMLANNQGQRLYQDLPGMGASFDHDIRAGVKMSDHYTAQQGWSTDIRSPTILKYHDRPYASTEHPSVPALHSSVEVSATVAAVKEAQGAKAASAVVNNAKVKKTNDAKSQHQPKVKTYPHQDRVTALKIRVPLEQFSASTHHTSSSEPSTSAVVSSTKSSATTKTVTRMTRNSVKASASQAPFTKTASKTKTRSANKKIVEKTVGCAGESPNATALDAAEESKSEAESEFEKKKKCYPDSIEAKKKKAGFDVRARKKHSDEAKKMGESVTITRLNGLTTISGVLWSALEYDITIPTTDEEFAALANEMLNAVNNFEGCKEVSTTKMFENRYGPNADHWTGTEKQAACTWVILEMVDIHTNGWTKIILDPDLRDAIQRTMYYTFKQRFDELIELLKYSKRTFNDLMKGERTYTIIGNPSALIDRTDSNAKSNARKGKALKAYNAMQVAMGLPEVEDLPEDVDIDELEELYETEEDLATAPKKSSKKRSREEDNVEGEALKRQKRARKEKDVEKAPKEKAKAKAKATGASRK